MDSQSINRRRFLRGTGLLLAGSLGAFGPAPALLRTASASPAGRAGPRGRAQMQEFVPDAEISIKAVQKQVQILPGAPTNVWGYELVEPDPVKGSGVIAGPVPGSYLGPIMRAQSGTNVRLTVYNYLNEPTVLHPHGLRVPHEADGQPMHAFPPMGTPDKDGFKVYEFKVIDPACPAWFHPHPMERTAEQVYMGLAGLFYVTDPVEQAAVPGAATGENDIPVIIQDRLFDSNNQFLYQPNNMWGMLGNTILVNGKPNTVLSLEPRGYRLRFLNGSNARTYKLGWSNNMPFKVIGTDGGLLTAAASRPYIMLMPGERVDVWADFTGLARQQIVLRSLSFSPGMMGGGGGMGMAAMDSPASTEGMDGMGGCGGCGGGGGGGGGMGGGMGSLANGAAFNILTVNVADTAATNPVLGPLPRSIGETYSRKNVGNFNNPVPFTLAMQRMVWTINGRIYNMTDMMEVAGDEMVTCNEPIAWQWINNSPIPHPMHIHSTQFRVIKRESPGTSSYATVSQGFVDSGWKDTVSVWPGERVTIAWRPGPYTGRNPEPYPVMDPMPYIGMYMYHCHILEHEDMTMMRNYMLMGDMPM